jgi:hypothetical protein
VSSTALPHGHYFGAVSGRRGREMERSGFYISGLGSTMQRGLHSGHMLVDVRRAGTLSGTVSASIAGLSWVGISFP